MALNFQKPTNIPQHDYNAPILAPSKYDPFEAIGNSEVSQKTAVISAGVYPLLYVDVLKIFRSKSADELIFVAEFDILDSQSTTNPPGTHACVIHKFIHKTTPGLIKAMLAAIGDVNVDGVTAEDAKMACSDANPLHGRLVRLQSSPVAGKVYLRNEWFAIPENVQERAEELRARVFPDLSVPF